MVDQTLQCRDCGADFVWTSGEQQFFQERGFANPPSRCPTCRAQRKNTMGGGGGGGRGGFGGGGGGFGGGGSANRQMFEAVCAECGGIARVPFEPRGDRPVYCSNCFRGKAR